MVEPMKNLMLYSGAEWVMWLLVGLSAVSLSIVLERWLVFRRHRGDVTALRRALAGDLDHGRLDAARRQLERSAHPAAKVVLRGMDRAAAAATTEQIERAMEAELLAQRARLERRLGFLGTLGNNAPFIGLFGTVIGIVGAFEQLGQANAGAADGSSALVMAAIAEALVATAVGIAVAIPAVFFFNHFLRELKQVGAAAELLSREWLAGRPATTPRGAV
ncbi:MAG: MotA/TolQ/ExbB proton channel family protein [Myxococcota bacterium]